MTAPAGAAHASQGNWFAAIPAPIPAAFLASLRDQSAPPYLRWFLAEDIHLTVAFFGRYDPARLAAVLATLQSLQPPVLDVTLGPLVPLPSSRHFTALSFELAAGAAETAAFMRAIHAPLMAAAGLPPDSRPPYPHITIARPHRRATAEDRAEILHWARSLTLPPLQIRLSTLGLYGWAADRNSRQFRRLDLPAPNPEA